MVLAKGRRWALASRSFLGGDATKSWRQKKRPKQIGDDTEISYDMSERKVVLQRGLERGYLVALGSSDLEG